jgi:hypothetical protein
MGLVDVAATVAGALDGAALPPGVAVLLESPRDVVLAAAEPGDLRDGLRALLRAAAEAMPAGGEVRVAVSREGPRVVVEVGDSGAPLSTSRHLEAAAALLGRGGAAVVRAAVPGRGNRSRVLLAAPSPPPLRGRPARRGV